MDPNKIVGIFDIPYNFFMGNGPIYEYLHKSFLLDFDVNDKNITYIQRIQYMFAVFFDFICSNMFIITTLVLMGMSIKDYSSFIQNPLLKNNILRLNGFIMFGVIGYLIIKFNNKLSENRKATAEDLETMNANQTVTEDNNDDDTQAAIDAAEASGIDLNKFDAKGVLQNNTNNAKQNMTNNIINSNVEKMKGQMPGMPGMPGMSGMPGAPDITGMQNFMK
jgi:hypothetical protein